MELSREELLKRANNGDISVYYRLAQEYYNHRHGLPDMIQAQIWAKKAIEAQVSSADAQALLTKLEGVVTDYALDCMKNGDDKFGFEAFLAEARIGHPLSMNNLSVCYYNGRGTAVDAQQAFYWMQQAAQHGFEGAYTPLASKYLYGDGVCSDLDQAEFWANKAIAAGKDADTAQSFLNKISEERRRNAGNAPSRHPLWNEGVKQYYAGNYTAAFDLFMRGAQDGDMMSMRNLCILYENGEGVTASRENAFRWALAAAQHGDCELYAVLGAKYMDGDGTAKDLDQAEFWANKAIAAGKDVDTAQSVLAAVKQRRPAGLPDEMCEQACQLLQQGEFDKAFPLLLSAAQAGIPLAMFNLSMLIYEGYGTGKDLAESFRWMKEAAEHGFTNSYSVLAYKYYDGDGVGEDLDQAEFWANKALQVNEGVEQANAVLAAVKQKRADNASPEQLCEQACQLLKQGNCADAFPLFQRSANAGYAKAMKNLSVMYDNGQGAAKDPVEAFRWMKAAAEHDYAPAYSILAIDYYNGDGTETDLDQAEFWANKAIEANNGVEQANEVLEAVCEQLFNEGIDSYEQLDYDRAFALFLRAAQAGFAPAMQNLSALCYDGEGTDQDFAESFRWIKEAAEHGFTSAYVPLAGKYLDGDGTDPDLDQAEFWAKKAIQAKEDVENANEILEIIKQDRDAATASPEFADQLCNQALDALRQNDSTRALSLFQRSANAGCATAMANLSVMYGTGHGVAKDPAEAFRWIKEAAEHGFAPAYSTLASKYYTGEGIAKDLDQAEFWANKAIQANDGVDDANAVLAAVKQRRAADTSPEQIYNQALQLLQQGKYDGAFPLFLRAAQAGHSRSMNMLSAMCAKGQGTVKDPAESFRWLKAAAEHGYVSAYPALAMKYVKAIGTDCNLEQAELWANKAIQAKVDVNRANSVLDMVRRCRSVANLSPEQACHQAFLLDQQKKYSEAFPVCLRSALSGCATAMNNLSVMYANGQGTDKDTAEAFRWMKAAAEHGCTYAYGALSNKYCYGFGTEPDFERAEFWANKALQANEGVELANGTLSSVKQQRTDPDSYANWLCDQAYRLSENKDYDRALPSLLYAAQAGHPRAMHNLSVMYANGQGTDKDPIEAFRWMKEAAEHGFTHSYSVLASKYLHGSGTEMDLEQAEFWANKAIQANIGLDLSNSILASVKQKRTDPDALVKQLCEQGYQFYKQKDYDRAFPLYLRAAQAGHAPAMNNVSVMYANGQGTDKDPAEAFRWMKATAEHGYTSAYAILARKYLDGKGTQQDLDQAEFWANKAIQSNAGVDDANAVLASVKQKRAGGAESDPLAQLCDQGFQLYQQKKSDEAFPLFLRSAQGGYPRGMYNLSVMYYNGYGTGKNPVEAFRWMKAAAEHGYTDAYASVADKYLYADGTETDLEQAKLWANKALEANAKAERAQYTLQLCSFSPEIAEAYNRGVTLFSDEKYKAALPLLVQAAKAGYPPALRQLGFAYTEGQGLQSHAPNADCFFEAAAYRGDATAARMLYQRTSFRPWAFMWRFYAQTLGLPGAENTYDRLRDAERTRYGNQPQSWDAKDAMTHAADRWSFYLRTRNRDGRYMITKNTDGTITHGNGSIDEALRYFSEAAKFGDPDGLCGMALVYETLSMKKEMMRCYFEAAYLGHSFAMYRVAQYCEASDRKASVACYQQSAKWGYPPAINWCSQHSVSY